MLRITAVIKICEMFKENINFLGMTILILNFCSVHLNDLLFTYSCLVHLNDLLFAYSCFVHLNDLLFAYSCLFI
jgi:hypothetical protein